MLPPPHLPDSIPLRALEKQTSPSWICSRWTRNCVSTLVSLRGSLRTSRINPGQLKWGLLARDRNCLSWRPLCLSHLQLHPMNTTTNLKALLPAHCWRATQMRRSLRDYLTIVSLIDYDCRRIIRNQKSPQPEPTATLILTFNSATLPDRISIRTGLTERVRPYILLTRRCFNCQQYGHSGAKCRRAKPVCVRCGLDVEGEHNPDNCQLR